MYKKYFTLFILISNVIFIYSNYCEENLNNCTKCNPVTNLCIRCDSEIYIPDSTGGCKYSNICKNGSNYCYECDESGNICKKCEEGYFPDQSGGCSYTANCLKSYRGECLECDEFYILIDNGFKYCKYNSSLDFANCQVINETTGFCDLCEDGYYLNAGDRRCIKTNNCYESVYGVCSECNPGYYLNKKENDCKRKEYPFVLCKETVDGETCEKCDDDSFMAEDGKCVDTNFCSVTYNTKYNCKECVSDYYLTVNKRACSDEKNCVKADKDTGLCDKCTDGHYLTKNRKCKSNTEDDEFKYCKEAKEDYCTQCEWGYYLGDDNQCTPSPNCTEASNGVCVLCNDGYYLGKDNICTTVEYCARADYYKNCVECVEEYYFDLSDKTCKEATGVFDHCLESNSIGDICLKCRDDYYKSAVDNLCYSNQEKGTFYKCALSTMDGKECYQCIDGYHYGLQDNKCTQAYVCLYSNEDHVCQECRYDYCLNKKNGNCYKNYETDLEQKVYFNCLETNEDGTECVKCAENYSVNKDGLCVNLNDCDSEEDEKCNKCKKNDSEDNLLCANEYYGCVQTLAKNCLRCDDLYDINICTKCHEGYVLDVNDECVKEEDD